MQKLLLTLLEYLAKRSVFFALYLHFVKGYKYGSRRKNIQHHVLDKEQPELVLAAIWDFSVWPYAMGDILNWNVCLCCKALEQDIKKIDIYVIVDENKPGPKMQSYIHPKNYERFLLDVLPAFHTNPLLNTVKIYKNREAFERELIELSVQKVECTPTANQYVEAINNIQHPTINSSYIGEFASINQFYKQNRFIPKLKAFKGIETIGQNLKLGFPKDVFFTALHLRHRKSEQGTAQILSTFARDVDFEVWIGFLEQVGQLYPNVRFLLVGRPEEMDRRILNLSNVIFLKNHGCSLAGELSAIVEADLFIGSNSGPAMMAMLSDVPYLVFQAEAGQEYTANVCEIEVGEPHLKFAQSNQKIVWSRQTAESILKEFANAYQLIRCKPGEDTVSNVKFV